VLPVVGSVVVMRHGQTAYNREGRMQGQLDIPLDSTGHHQAATAAQALVGAGITRIITSDLSRAQSTAATIAEALGLPLLLDARLREQHYGEWQGLTLAEIAASWPGRREPVDGESLPEVAARAVAAVLEHLPPSGALLVVTHGDTARGLLGRLRGLPEEEWDGLPALGNADWVHVGDTSKVTRVSRRTGESIPA
jgi:probable phosphoglycerate mutase